MNFNPLIESNWAWALLPEIILSCAGMVIILFDAFFGKMKSWLGPLAIITILGTIWSELHSATGVFFAGSYEISAITRLFDFTFLLAALLVVMLAREYLRREAIEGGEFYALIMWGTVGMMMMAKGLDLIIVVLGLEMLSICIFALVGYHRRIAISNEASLKYFLMGAFATGFILYGTALFYGATGSTRVADLGTVLAGASTANPLLTIAFVMIMGGIGFKLALAPFHGWAPDVYQGAPTPVAAWLSVAPKAATLIALMRIISEILPEARTFGWMTVIAVLSIASMVMGNFVAIAQRDLKRMLAYSGIAHVGYMMIAVLVLGEDAVAAVAVYTITYALMNIGAFGVVSLLDKNQNDPQTLQDISGLGFRKPFLGLVLALFMFSLAGIPPTAGFVSKFFVFKTAIQEGQIAIAVIGILTSIVSVYYYLRVVYYLYMKEADEALTPMPVSGVLSTSALAIAALGILAIGIFPTPLFETALQAAAALFMN